MSTTKEPCDWKRETYYLVRLLDSGEEVRIPEYNYFCRTHGLSKSEHE